MIDRELRTTKTRLVSPIARKLGDTSPTAITLGALGFGLFSALLAAAGSYPAALGLWLLNRIFDGLDGEVARASGRQSDWGGYLDILADLLVYSLLPIALVFSNQTPATWIALALMLASFYLNAGSWMMLSSILEKRGCGTRIRSEKTTVTMPAGLIEGAETIVLYSLFLIFPNALPTLLTLTTVLVLITIAQRLVWAFGVLRSRPLCSAHEVTADFRIGL